MKDCGSCLAVSSTTAAGLQYPCNLHLINCETRHARSLGTSWFMGVVKSLAVDKHNPDDGRVHAREPSQRRRAQSARERASASEGKLRNPVVLGADRRAPDTSFDLQSLNRRRGFATSENEELRICGVMETMAGPDDFILLRLLAFVKSEEISAGPRSTLEIRPTSVRQERTLTFSPQCPPRSFLALQPLVSVMRGPSGA